METSTRTHDDGTVELAIAGDVDLSVADELRNQAVDLLDGPGTNALRINLADVTFIDSTGLSVLIAVGNAATERGSTLTLAAPSSRVLRVLEIAGLRTWFFTADGIVMTTHVATVTAGKRSPR